MLDSLVCSHTFCLIIFKTLVCEHYDNLARAVIIQHESCRSDEPMPPNLKVDQAMTYWELALQVSFSSNLKLQNAVNITDISYIYITTNTSPWPSP